MIILIAKFYYIVDTNVPMTKRLKFHINLFPRHLVRTQDPVQFGSLATNSDTISQKHLIVG